MSASLNGTLQYVVGECSASPNIQDVERAVIQQDHFHGSKFEDDCASGFDLVTEAILRYTRGAPEIILRRWGFEKEEQKTRKQDKVEEILPGTNGLSMQLSLHRATVQLTGPSDRLYSHAFMLTHCQVLDRHAITSSHESQLKTSLVAKPSLFRSRCISQTPPKNRRNG